MAHHGTTASRAPRARACGAPGERRRGRRPHAGRSWACATRSACSGSGNFVATQALHAAGAAFHHARHEGGAICMADGYARVSGARRRLQRASGPGLHQRDDRADRGGQEPHAAAGARGRGAAPPRCARTSGIDQAALAETVGAVAERVHSAASAAADDAARACRRARSSGGRCCSACRSTCRPSRRRRPRAARRAPRCRAAPPRAPAVAEVAELLAARRAPGHPRRPRRGARRRARALEALGDAIGAVLATSAMGHGLFAGSPWAVGISGGFASPLARAADRRVRPGPRLRRRADPLDDARRRADRPARRSSRSTSTRTLGAHRPGRRRGGRRRRRDRAGAARRARRAGTGVRARTRSPRRSPPARWRDEPYEDAGANGRMDPRTLSIALDALLPAERTVAVDSGHFMGFPPMYLRVPDPPASCSRRRSSRSASAWPAAIGAAIARPDRLTVACLGDGGALMSLPELETLARLRLPMLVVIYDDAAYGAEVHHFRPHGPPGRARPVPRHRLRRARRGRRRARRDGAQRRGPRRGRATGWPSATARWSSMRRSRPTSARNGSRRPSR